MTNSQMYGQRLSNVRNDHFSPLHDEPSPPKDEATEQPRVGPTDRRTDGPKNCVASAPANASAPLRDLVMTFVTFCQQDCDCVYAFDDLLFSALWTSASQKESIRVSAFFSLSFHFFFFLFFSFSYCVSHSLVRHKFSALFSSSHPVFTSVEHILSGRLIRIHRLGVLFPGAFVPAYTRIMR